MFYQKAEKNAIRSNAIKKVFCIAKTLTFSRISLDKVMSGKESSCGKWFIS